MKQFIFFQPLLFLLSIVIAASAMMLGRIASNGRGLIVAVSIALLFGLPLFMIVGGVRLVQLQHLEGAMRSDTASASLRIPVEESPRGLPADSIVNTRLPAWVVDKPGSLQHGRSDFSLASRPKMTKELARQDAWRIATSELSKTLRKVYPESADHDDLTLIFQQANVVLDEYLETYELEIADGTETRMYVLHMKVDGSQAALGSIGTLWKRETASLRSRWLVAVILAISGSFTMTWYLLCRSPQLPSGSGQRELAETQAMADVED